MRYKILLYGLIAAAISSCSSAYKASQTPDDVYYSPARAAVAKESATANNDRYVDYVSSQDDQYLRMKVQDRERWSSIDDYSYWNDSRYIPSYNYNYSFFSNNLYYNPYAFNSWNSPYYNFYYNQYYTSGFGLGYFYPQYGYGYSSYYAPTYIVKYPTRLSPSVSRPNLNGYRNGMYNNRNSANSYNNGNSGLGNTMRRVFSGGNNDNYSNRNINTNSYSSPSRSYTPSSSGSSSGSRSGGGVSRPPR